MHPCFFVRPPHPPGQVDLDHGQYLRIVFASGWAVQLDAGTALATVYNVREDILLADGMQLIIPNNGLTLVEAIGSCQLRLTSPQTAGLHRTRYWKLPFLYPSMTLGALSVPHEQNFCRVTTALKKKEDLCRADGQTNPLPVCKMSS